MLADHPMHARRAATRGAVVVHMLVMALDGGHDANVMSGWRQCQRSARKWLLRRASLLSTALAGGELLIDVVEGGEELGAD